MFNSEIERIKALQEKFLSPVELNGLLQATSSSIRDYAIILTAYNHGLRISEVGLLQLEDFKEQENRIKIHRVKGGFNNTYVMHDDTRKAIKKWLVLRNKEPGALFQSRKQVSTTEGISKRQLDTLFKKYAEKGGVLEKHWHFHTLRHTCAVNMVDKGVPLKNIQDWLGHTSIQSTMLYAQVSDAAREKTAELFYGGKQGEEVKKVSKTNWKGDKKK